MVTSRVSSWPATTAERQANRAWLWSSARRIVTGVSVHSSSGPGELGGCPLACAPIHGPTSFAQGVWVDVPTVAPALVEAAPGSASADAAAVWDAKPWTSAQLSSTAPIVTLKLVRGQITLAPLMPLNRPPVVSSGSRS